MARRVEAPLALVGTPLSGVVTGGETGPRVARSLSVVEHGTSELLALIGRLLSFRGVRGSGLSLSLRGRGVGALIGSILSQFDLSFQRRNGRFACGTNRRSVVTVISERTFAGVIDGVFGGTLGCSRRGVGVDLKGGNKSYFLVISGSNRVVPRDGHRTVFGRFCERAGGDCGPNANVNLCLTHRLTRLRGNGLVVGRRKKVGGFVLAVPLNARCVDVRATRRANKVRGRRARRRLLTCVKTKRAVLMIRSSLRVYRFVEGCLDRA